MYGINFGVLGAGANYYFNIPFYGGFSLYFGQIFVLLCLLTRGLNAGIIAATIASSALAYHTHDPFAFVIYVSEVFAVHAMLRRGKALLPAVILYWATLGVPVTIALMLLTTDAKHDLLVIAGMAMSINAFFCACISALVYSFIPVHSIYRNYKSAPPAFSSVIFGLCMLTVSIPTLAIALIFTAQTSAQKEISLDEQLLMHATALAQDTDTFFTTQKRGVETLANTLRDKFDGDQLRRLLFATNQNYPFLQSMLISDEKGQINYASPAQFARMLQGPMAHSVADRAYFINTKSSLTTTISEAIAGKGFGSHPIVTISAPIVRDEAFKGIVQGAVSLANLNRLQEALVSKANQFEYVITDAQGKVVFSTANIGLPALSNFDYVETQNMMIQRIPKLEIHQQQYLFKQVKSALGWTITIMADPNNVTAIISESFYIFMGSICITLVLVAIVTNQLSKRITRPLVALADHFNDDSTHESLTREAQLSEEFVKVTDKLLHSRDLMRNFQQQLSAQVDEKTKQLKLLNEQLHTLAQKDGLTNLLNRAGFDELAQTAYSQSIRNNIPVSMMLMDIDFFKQVNDTYGHPFGDKCIVGVANMLTQHCQRDTDIIGRYGGEEFIALIVGGKLDEHKALLKKIHRAIEKMLINEGDITVQFTVSMGVCSIQSNHKVTIAELIVLADEQLYKSKRAGRNMITFTTV